MGPASALQITPLTAPHALMTATRAPMTCAMDTVLAHTRSSLRVPLVVISPPQSARIRTPAMAQEPVCPTMNRPAIPVLMTATNALMTNAMGMGPARTRTNHTELFARMTATRAPMTCAMAIVPASTRSSQPAPPAVINLTQTAQTRTPAIAQACVWTIMLHPAPPARTEYSATELKLATG
jgi:hypothetical protein